MRLTTTSVLTIWLLLAVLGDAAASPFTFVALPEGGAVTGLPGDTVGWGYSISNTSADYWLEITALDASVVEHGTPDSSIFTFPILSPGETKTVTYDAVSGMGLLQFTWDVTAPIGFVNAGEFTLWGAFHDGDPGEGGQFVGDAESQSAPFSATVTVRESPLGPLMLLGLIALMVGAGRSNEGSRLRDEKGR